MWWAKQVKHKYNYKPAKLLNNIFYVVYIYFCIDEQRTHGGMHVESEGQ